MSEHVDVNDEAFHPTEQPGSVESLPPTEQLVEACPPTAASVESFRFVVFLNAYSSYPAAADYPLSYEIDLGKVVPTSGDWVGLYQIGWLSAARDYITYNYAPMPQKGENKQTLLFPAKQLPGDDGSLYQFCYVSSSGKVYGASTPIQFVAPTSSTTNDYIEVEDEETDMMMVKSRTVVLEDNLHQVREETKSLKKTVEVLNGQTDTQNMQIQDQNMQIQDLKEEVEQVQRDLQLANMKLADQDTILTQRDETIKNLTQEIKILQDKNTELDKTKTRLEEVFEKSFNSCQSDLDGLKMTIADHEKTIADHEKTIADHEKTIADHEKTIAMKDEETRWLAMKLEETEAVLEYAKEELGDVARKSIMNKTFTDELQAEIKNGETTLKAAEECILNSENKWQAAEASKQMLHMELEAKNQALDKMSNDLEASKNEAFNAQQSLDTLNQLFNESLGECQRKEQELEYLQESRQQDKEKWSAERKSLEEKMMKDRKEDFEGPMYALKQVQNNLHERLTKKSKECEEWKKVVQQQKASRENSAHGEAAMREEILVLKEHLLMGQKSYQQKHVECQKLHSDLKRAVKAQKKPDDVLSNESAEKLKIMEAQNKRYKCDLPGCDLAFINSNKLERHVKCHTAQYLVQAQQEKELCDAMLMQYQEEKKNIEKEAAKTIQFQLEVERLKAITEKNMKAPSPAPPTTPCTPAASVPPCTPAVPVNAVTPCTSPASVNATCGTATPYSVSSSVSSTQQQTDDTEESTSTRKCPICAVTFSPDRPVAEFEAHVNDHLNRCAASDVEAQAVARCPICGVYFSCDNPVQQRQMHVNSHYDD